MLEVVNGTAVALVLKVVGVGLAFSFNILLARMLGVEGAGIYFLALTVATIATVFGRMGLDNALLRFTAANATIDNWEAVKGVYSKGMRLALIASSVSATTMYFVAPLLANMVFHKPELAVPLRWMALAVVPMSLLILHAEMLKGLKRIRDSLLIYGVGVPALSLIGLYSLGRNRGINGAVWAYTIATVIMVVLGTRLWRLATPQLHNIVGSFVTSELLKSSVPLFWVAFLSMMINWMAVFSLAIWGTNEDIGVFAIAIRVAMLISLVLLPVNSISAPKFAALYEKKDLMALGSMARNTTTLMALMASPLLILCLIVPGWIMGIFGKEFAGGGYLLAIMAIGEFINVATGSVGYLLMMSGNERIMRNNVIFIAVLSVVLNVILVPSFGVTGAAISIAICLSLMNLISALFVWLRLGICTIPVIRISR